MTPTLFMLLLNNAVLKEKNKGKLLQCFGSKISEFVTLLTSKMA